MSNFKTELYITISCIAVVIGASLFSCDQAKSRCDKAYQPAGGEMVHWGSGKNKHRACIPRVVLKKFTE